MGRVNLTLCDEHEKVLDAMDGEQQTDNIRTCIEAYPQVEKLEAELTVKENKIEKL